MVTEVELLRAVLANPDADAPRRAYMEWALARGDRRGEFIRVQLALAEAYRRNAFVAEWGPLYRESEALVQEWGALWRQPLEPIVFTHVIENPGFRRGFVENVTMDATTFERDAPRVYALAPVRCVSLRNVVTSPGALASPYLARLSALDLSGRGVDDATIRVLAQSPHVRKLTWLDVSANRIGAAGLEAMVASPYLRGLRYVNFVGNTVDDPTEGYGTEGEWIASAYETDLGRELEQRHGRIAWLHWPSEFRQAGGLYPDHVAPY
jgi:uncharacterized protein (TIGR02996 family)